MMVHTLNARFPLALAAALTGCAASPDTGGDPDLPYVYTEWEHYTVDDGLPNDHVFAVAVQGSKVWIGTENGLPPLALPPANLTIPSKEIGSRVLFHRGRQTQARAQAE